MAFGTLCGSVIIAQTPFDERGAVDLASIDTLVEFYLGHGADGFVVLGVSGEVMRRRGAIRHATMRRPGPSPSPTHLAEIDLLPARLGRALAETR